MSDERRESVNLRYSIRGSNFLVDRKPVVWRVTGYLATFDRRMGRIARIAARKVYSIRDYLGGDATLCGGPALVSACWLVSIISCRKDLYVRVLSGQISGSDFGEFGDHAETFGEPFAGRMHGAKGDLRTWVVCCAVA